MEMEDLYSIHPGITRSAAAAAAAADGGDGRDLSLSEALKAQIASHPRYPFLLSAYVQCRKVGAPPETASMLEEIVRERCASMSVSSFSEIGADPELDDFMDTYCRVLMRYKEELSKPFDEAASFLSSIENQLSTLCSNTTGGGSSSSNKGCTTTTSSSTATITTTTSSTGLSDDFAGSSDEEEPCMGDVVADREISDLHEAGITGSSSSAGTRSVDNELKEMLLKKYSGYLSHLRKEFLKKRKKGKLPRDARSTLLDWWSTHYRWPYPTEEDKVRLASMTGLDPKQINNWFINQRKRHWKPSEDMRFALMEGVSAGSSTGTTTLYFDTGTVGP